MNNDQVVQFFVLKKKSISFHPSKIYFYLLMLLDGQLDKSNYISSMKHVGGIWVYYSVEHMNRKETSSLGYYIAPRYKID
mmetsp:Transcript_29580/g.44025  ORF Transcript_29580/g.44025 Transcript_29580/m.44025 type:complete len:80 (+) Transcript_29580:3377-3616(+)